MEEVNSLVNVPENMHSFFKEKTYIKTDDPKVFEKIGNHLVLMRHHDVKDDNVELEHLVANQDEIWQKEIMYYVLFSRQAFRRDLSDLGEHFCPLLL